MEMRNLIKPLIIITCCIPKIADCSSNVTDIFDDKSGDRYTFSNDTVIHPGVSVDLNNIDIANSITIDNRGFLGGNMNICSGCHVFVHNSGEFNGEINLAPGAHLTQVIANTNEITDLGVYDDFDILVCDGVDISFDTLMMVGALANRITLDGVVLRMDDASTSYRRRMFPDIELRGNVSVVLGTLDGVLNGDAVLSNVSGDGVLNFYSADLDAIHALVGRVENGKAYVELVRETDYFKIFKNATGEFLNDLRRVSANDPLLGAMDTAPDIDSMYDIMSRSVRLHPINMMRPVRTYMAMRDIDALSRNNEIGIGPRITWSSDYYMYGMGVTVDFNASDNWHVFASFGAGRMEYADDINIFAADVYDGGIGINYDNGRVIHRARMAVAMSRFDIGAVFDGNDTIYNPTGIAMRAMYETGRRFHISSNIDFIPMIGLNADAAYVNDNHDYTFNGNGGADITIDGDCFVLDYDYLARVRVNTNGDVSGAVGVTMRSDADGVGGDISVGIMHNDIGTSYNAMATLRIAF